jgi:hypothetical protein
MEKKKARIQIKDLDVDLEELKKISPEVLAKIHGGWGVIAGMRQTYACLAVGQPMTSGCVMTAKLCGPG